MSAQEKFWAGVAEPAWQKAASLQFRHIASSSVADALQFFGWVTPTLRSVGPLNKLRLNLSSRLKEWTWMITWKLCVSFILYLLCQSNELIRYSFFFIILSKKISNEHSSLRLGFDKSKTLFLYFSRIMIFEDK